ncbi:MAG: hypothetical protein OHK006_15730 [Thermodesulfovibrionales bacterium]
MIFRNKIVIKAASGTLWEHLTDAVKMQAWNPNIKAFIPVTRGPITAGYRFRVRYRLEHTENNFLAEVIEYEPNAKLSIHLTGGNFPRRGYALEIYELTDHKHGVLVRQTIEIQNAAANVFVKGVALLKYFAARSRGKAALKGLKKLAESVG